MSEPMPVARTDIRQKLAEAVSEFCGAIGYPAVRLAIDGPHYRYDFVERRGDEPQYPHSDNAGCYVFADDSGKILYVGKGSRHIGSRIAAPFGRWKRDGESEPFPDAAQWIKDNKPGVWVIAFPDEHWWLASALESFMIEKFDPPVNKRDR
ncbi:MAG TPA: hypothetical protein VGJ26_01755 [Pirellulales bacterium]|jgi:hypothetical protein